MAIRTVLCLLNGRSLPLRLDLNAWAELEDAGYSLETMLGQLRQGSLTMRGVRALLWAMVQGTEPPPSLRDVGHWVDGGNFGTVLESVGEALRLAFPEPGTDPPPPGAGTGASSSALPTVPSP